MKRRNTLTFILLGLLSLSMISCGSDNNGDGGGNNSTPPVVATPTVTITGALDNNYVNLYNCESSSSFDDFKNKVNSAYFKTERSHTETYYYVEQELDIDVNTRKFLWMIPYNTTTYSWDRIGEFERHGQRGVQEISHQEAYNKTEVRDMLNSILSNAVNRRGGGSYYEVLLNTGEVFGISLCVPITANPVYRYNMQSGIRYYYTGTTGSYDTNWGYNPYTMYGY